MTLFVSDLDGTLLGDDAQVSPRSVALLNEAISQGALFSIATARTPSTVSGLMKDIDLRLPLIVMTGSAIWDARTGQYLRNITMPRHVAEEIFAVIKKHDLPTFIYTLGDPGKAGCPQPAKRVASPDRVIDIYHYGPLSELESNFIDERKDSPYKRFHIPDTGRSGCPQPDGVIGRYSPGGLGQPALPVSDVILFYAMQPSKSTEAAYKEIREIAGCTPIYYHDMFGPDTGIMEVFDAAASKANALRWLKEYTGADRVVAFGDNLNDIPMLRAADVAVAVDNAVPEVKAVADIIIGPNTADSVAEYINVEFRI